MTVRMVRPAWESCANPGGYVMCTCGQVLQCRETMREHWQLGHFDKVHPDDLAPESPTAVKV